MTRRAEMDPSPGFVTESRTCGTFRGPLDVRTTMTVRAATPEDAPAIRRVARASWHAAHDHVVGEETVEEVIEEWYDVDGLGESIERDDRPTFVAVEDEVVGFAQGGPTEEGPADAVVSRIYVHPDHWGKGHGTALLERLFEHLRTAGEESVWLAVVADNEVGRSFYDDHGFEVHEERTVELFGRTVEDVVMVRPL